MKKSGFINLVISAIIVAVFSCSAVFATPIYIGDTVAPDDLVWETVGGQSGWVPQQPKPSGYYIWSNDDRTEWSIRWTAGENDDDKNDPVYEWWGSLEFGEHGLDLVSYSPVFWDSNDGIITLSDGSSNSQVTWDVISFDATAGWHWDGIDFSIEGDYGDLIGFNLGSTLFNTLDLAIGSEVDGAGIFIGSQYSTPTVLASSVSGDDNRAYITQNFEVNAPIPEPGTMMLVGFGLLGLCGYGYRRKKK